jgi:tetratricopeptide (TPR) repeat protein
MTFVLSRMLAAVLLASLTVLPGRQGVDDAALRAAVEQFFATQQAEDVGAYLALWSASARRPTAEQLKYVFEAGDDTYSDIAIVATSPAAAGVRVRVRATRDRSTPSRVPGRPPLTFHSTASWNLVYVRENNDWKLVREGPAVDGLADDLLDASTAEERDALILAEPDLVTVELVIALSRRGGQAAQEQQYARAQAGFERMRDVARVVGDTRYEGEALQNIANAMYFQRNLPGALAAYEERLAIERARDDQAGIAAALLGIGTIRYSFAEYGTALAAYHQAVAILERQSNDSALATTFISTGNIFYLQGEFTAAITDYARSRELSRKASNSAGEADALEGLGRVYIAQGDYAAALEALGSVLADGKARNDRKDQATALLSIGDVHFRLGNIDSARAALVESRTHFEAVKDLAHVGRVWQGIALVDLVANRFPASEDAYNKSADICAKASDAECSAGATAGLAFALTAQDKFAEGIASYTRAIAAFTQLGKPEPAARAGVGLSRALAGSGDFAAALVAADRARDEAEKLANDDVLWRAQVAQAEALRRLRDRPKALAAAHLAVAAVDRLVAVASIRPSAVVPRDSSSAFATLALLQAEDGDAAAAFETSERMRVHDLRVLLLRTERDIHRGMSPQEREDERRLAGEIVSLYAQLSRERGLPKPDGARMARLEKAASEATEKKAAQQQALFSRLPALGIWRGLMAPATRLDVEKLLPDTSTVVVEFVVHEDSLLVLVVRRGENGLRFSSQFEPASRRRLADRVTRLLQPEPLRDIVSWRKATLEFIPGLAATFGTATRAIVVPHEVLWRVPFEALATEDGLLADRTSITYAPSLTMLARAPEKAAETGPSAIVLAVAAPELTPAVLEEVARTSPAWSIRPAAGAEKEIAAVARGGDPARVQTLSASSATESAVIERLPAADVLHLAAPFRVNGASPLFSPMLLARDASSDGTLEAREIMNLELRADVAVLSDGGAMSMRDAADEVGLIAWAWRAAGVRDFVLPRWSTDDDASAAFFAVLHEGLRAGDAPAVALQTARDTVRANRATAAPFYWAAWMVVDFR